MISSHDLQRLVEHRLVVRKGKSLPYDAARGKRHMLPKIWQEADMPNGVEVGTFRGDFAKLIIDSYPEVHLACVDPYVEFGGKSQADQDRYFLEASQKLLTKAVMNRVPSLTAVHCYNDGQLDWVWIDGDHSFDAAVQDIIQWSKKVRSGGMICIHDYDTYQTGVVDAVNGYTRAHGIKDWYVTREYPSTAIWINP